jgi:hypothetical protein
MAVTNGYPSGSESSTIAAPASSTMAAEITSLEQFNNLEMDVVDISYASGKQKFLQTILALGRLRNGGDLKSQGLTEVISDNFPNIQWLEQDEEAKILTLNGTMTNVATTMVLVSTVGVLPGMMIRINETNENVSVTTVDSATNLTVVRGQGSIAGTAVAGASGKVTLLGLAAQAGYSNPDALGSNGVQKTNYIQTFIDSVDVNNFNQMSAKIG